MAPTRIRRSAGGIDFDIAYVDGRRWRVTHDLTYHLSDGLCVQVPAGFLTDMASIPRPLWWIVGPPTGDGKGKEYGIAAVLHDYLYTIKRVSGRKVPRRQADAAFLETLLATSVRPFWAYTLWCGVRVGGWWSWMRRGPRRVR
jgi:hypothetical protein